MKNKLILCIFALIFSFILLTPFLSANDLANLGLFQGNSTTDGYDLNSLTKYAFVWENQSYDENIFYYDVLNPSRIKIIEGGNYFISYQLPVHDSTYSGSNNNRMAIQSEFRINETKADIGFAESSYMRGEGGSTGDHFESSNTYTGLINISAGDYLEIFVGNEGGDGTEVMWTEGGRLFMEKIEESEEIFFGVGTQSTSASNPTDLDQGTVDSFTYDMEWTEVIEDSTYTHSDSSDENIITLEEAGTYYVAVNIPTYDSSGRDRASVGLRLELDNNEILGTRGLTGYMRSDSDEGNDYASIHFAGLIEASAGQNLTVGISSMGSSGTVTVGGNNATLLIRKLEDNKGLFKANISTLESGTNWNPTSLINVTYTDIDLEDTDYYSYTVGEPNIMVLKNGTYYFSIASPELTSGDARTAPQFEIFVNGVEIPSLRSGSTYDRQAGMDESTTMASFAITLIENDNVTMTVREEQSSTNSGNVALLKQGTMSIIYKAQSLSVDWESSSLNMGAKLQTNGNSTDSISVVASGDQYKINVSCISGNCTSITTNWTNQTNLLDGESKLAHFVCSNQTVGDFSASFNVTSFNYTKGDLLNIFCVVSDSKTVIWSDLSLELGSVYNGMYINSNSSFDVAGENTNILVNELQGNGTGFISATPWDIGTLPGASNQQILFNCSPNAGQPSGFYQVTYNVNSTEDVIGSNITVSCDVVSSFVFWNQTSLIQGNVYSGNNIAGNAGFYSAGFNVEVNVNEISGNGIDFISANVSSIGNMTDDSFYEVNFICSPPEDQVAGNYNAIYNLNTTYNSTGMNITVDCDVLTPLIEYNQSTLTMISSLNLGNATGVISVQSTGISNDTEIYCVSGDCSKIGSNWTSGKDMSNGEAVQVEFTCDDSSVGDFTGDFIVNSTQNPGGDTATVNCDILQSYGYLNVSLITPNISEINNASRNEYFWINATVNCVGSVGSSCENVYGVVRDNSTNIFGDGSDGELNVTSSEVIINNYTYLTTNVSIGSSYINISDSSEFLPGDEIMIIQIQNHSGGQAGSYEFNYISSISGQNITLTKSLEKAYYTGIFNQTSATATQIIKIPHYTDVNINGSIISSAWNGYTGGIVVFRANGTINFTGGNIDVSQKGFRGGDCNGCGNNAWGDQGEGYLGLGEGILSANANGGGGGYGPTGYSGEPGGGGGYGTAGEGVDCDFDVEGGSAIGSENLDLMFFGGGAGAGGDNDGRTPYPEYVDGGGIAIIIGKEIINATINADGEEGITPTSGSGQGATGGGAGGTIWLRGENITIGNVTTLGKIGGTTGDNEVGGTGGQGRVRLDFLSLTGSSQPESEYNGSLQEMIQINYASGNPFHSLTSQPQNCGQMFSGDSCQLNWSINSTGSLDSFWKLDVNFFSSSSKVPKNNTDNTTIRIVVGDTCTYVGGGNWSIDCSDNCVFTTTQTIPGQNNVTIFGSGNLNFSSGGKWDFTGSNQYITVDPGCTLNINPGGGWSF